MIERELLRLKPDCVITGGASGIDTEAEHIAAKNGIPVEVIRPSTRDAKSRGAVMKAIRQRNEKIIDLSDIVLAIPSFDRKGGTEMGIKRAQRIGKTLIIHARSSNEQEQSRLPAV